MRHKRWPVARAILSVVMLVVALPIYLHSQEGDSAPPPVAAATAQHRTQVNHHETPCEHRERVARGIPAYSVDGSKGLLAYVRAHLDGTTPDAELADFWKAMDACDQNEPVAKWDFDSMILTHVEFLPPTS